MLNRWRSASAGQVLRSLHHSRSVHPFESESCPYHTIQAFLREFPGNRFSAKEGPDDRIPTVVYSQNRASRRLFLTTERNQIQSILDSVQLPIFCCTTLLLQIRAWSESAVLQSSKVLPVKIRREKDSGTILDLEFIWVEEGSELTVNVPIVFKGLDVCPGLKKGGQLNKLRTSLKYLCPAEHIPPKLEVDVSSLDLGDKVSLSDVKVHPSMKLLSTNKSMPICKIVAETPE